MSEIRPDPMKRSPQQIAREEALAKAMRENLVRRKQYQRAVHQKSLLVENITVPPSPLPNPLQKKDS